MRIFCFLSLILSLASIDAAVGTPPFRSSAVNGKQSTLPCRRHWSSNNRASSRVVQSQLTSPQSLPRNPDDVRKTLRRYEKETRTRALFDISAPTSRDVLQNFQTTLDSADDYWAQIQDDHRQRVSQFSGDFNAWLTTKYIEPAIERQLSDMLSKRMALLGAEFDMALPLINSPDQPAAMAINRKLSPVARRVFQAVMRADKAMRTIGRLLRQAVLIIVQQLLNGIPDIFKSLAVVIAAHSKPPVLTGLKDQREWMTSMVEQTHGPIMREIDDRILEVLINHIATNGAVFGARTVKAFFGLVLESIKTGETDVAQRIRDAINTTCTWISLFYLF
jgi:hypothetical protein